MGIEERLVEQWFTEYGSSMPLISAPRVASQRAANAEGLQEPRHEKAMRIRC